MLTHLILRVLWSRWYVDFTGKEIKAGYQFTLDLTP